jgi:hypothetical protein
MRTFTLAALLILLFSISNCALLGLEEEEDSTTTSTPTASTVTTVTLRAYELDDNATSSSTPITNAEKQANTFTEINDSTISSRGWKMTDTGKTYSVDVGVPCDSWERTETGHGAQGNLEANYNSHSHYNAADNTSYVNGIYSWTEFGPEHTQANIDTTCSIGTGGVNKTANSDNYTADVNIYLKIDSVTTR